jgi:hypothetical protein
MKRKVSLPSSEKTATGASLTQMNPVNIIWPYFFSIHFNIILPFTLRSSKWPLPLRFSGSNFVCIPHLCTKVGNFLTSDCQFLKRTLLHGETYEPQRNFRHFVKGKCKVIHVLNQAPHHEDVQGSGNRVPRTLNLCPRWRSASRPVRFTREKVVCNRKRQRVSNARKFSLQLSHKYSCFSFGGPEFDLGPETAIITEIFRCFSPSQQANARVGP